MCNSSKPLFARRLFALICVCLFIIVASQSNAEAATRLGRYSRSPKGVPAAAWTVAANAYFQAKQQKVAKQPYLVIIDFSLPSNAKRLWLVDMRTKAVMLNTHVAHGRNSGGLNASQFSNAHQSYRSSLGIYVGGTRYQGKHGLSLNLHGLEPGFNDNAYARRVVLHGADYVSDGFINANGYAGRSLGCPAVAYQHVAPLVQALEGGGVLVAYHPTPVWLARSNWINV